MWYVWGAAASLRSETNESTHAQLFAPAPHTGLACLQRDASPHACSCACLGKVPKGSRLASNVTHLSANPAEEEWLIAPYAPMTCMSETKLSSINPHSHEQVG